MNETADKAMAAYRAMLAAHDEDLIAQTKADFCDELKERIQNIRHELDMIETWILGIQPAKPEIKRKRAATVANAQQVAAVQEWFRTRPAVFAFAKDIAGEVNIGPRITAAACRHLFHYGALNYVQGKGYQYRMPADGIKETDAINAEECIPRPRGDGPSTVS